MRGLLATIESRYAAWLSSDCRAREKILLRGYFEDFYTTLPLRSICWIG